MKRSVFEMYTGRKLGEKYVGFFSNLHDGNATVIL
jgi:hypothetical protein